MKISEDWRQKYAPATDLVIRFDLTSLYEFPYYVVIEVPWFSKMFLKILPIYF
jgi:hypothetical protein